MEDYNKNNLFWKDFINIQNNPYKLKSDLDGFNCLVIHLTREGDFSGWDYPITIGYMASLLRMNGANATISIKDIKSYEPLEFSGYNLICFYPMVALFKETLELCKKVKNDFPDSKICLFNSDQHQHEMLLCNTKAAELGKNIMNECKCIDYILIGEAEFSFIKLCEKIHKKENDMKNIPACLYRADDSILLSNAAPRPVEFDFLPFASRDFLEKGVVDGINQLSPRLQTSRGCCGDCGYCAESFVNITEGGRKNPVLQRDIFKAINEIEMLYNQYNVRFFNIIDSSFEDPGEKGIRRMELFCKEIIKRGIQCSFKIHLRANTISNFDNDFLTLLKKAGIDILIIGIESNIEKELKSYTSKMRSVTKNVDNILRLDKTDKFWTLIGFLMFSACLKLEDLKKKIEFLKNINRGWDFLLMSYNLIAFRGSTYHDYLIKEDLALSCDKLSPVVPYKYEDGRIRYVSKEINSLKQKCPATILLNNCLYDANNILARYSNKMNEQLWGKESLFTNFKKEISSIMNDSQRIYNQYFNNLVNLAQDGWSSEKADLIFKKHIFGIIPKKYDETRQLIRDFMLNLEKAGLSTQTLYMKTWMSLINSQVNTTGGKVE